MMDKKFLPPILVILGVLFSGNVFFVARLVDKIERTENTVWDLKIEITSLKDSIANLSENVDSVKRRMRKHAESE